MLALTIIKTGSWSMLPSTLFTELKPLIKVFHTKIRYYIFLFLQFFFPYWTLKWQPKLRIDRDPYKSLSFFWFSKWALLAFCDVVENKLELVCLDISIKVYSLSPKYHGKSGCCTFIFPLNWGLCLRILDNNTFFDVFHAF